MALTKARGSSVTRAPVGGSTVSSEEPTTEAKSTNPKFKPNPRVREKIDKVQRAVTRRNEQGKIIRLAQAVVAAPTRDSIDALLEAVGEIEPAVIAAPDPAPYDRMEKAGHTRGKPKDDPEDA